MFHSFHKPDILQVQRMIDAAQDIVPLRARRERLRQPIEAVAICKFQSKEISIQKVRIVCGLHGNLVFIS